MTKGEGRDVRSVRYTLNLPVAYVKADKAGIV